MQRIETWAHPVERKKIHINIQNLGQWVIFCRLNLSAQERQRQMYLERTFWSTAELCFFIYLLCWWKWCGMKELPPLSEQNVLSGAPHKPFTGQRLFLTFAWDSKCQRAKRLSLISRQKLLASAQPAECWQSENQTFTEKNTPPGRAPPTLRYSTPPAPCSSCTLFFFN